MHHFKLIIPALFFLLMLPTLLPAENSAETDRQAMELIQTLGCKGCHTIKGDGGSLAADLTQIGSRMTAEQIYAQLIAKPDSRKTGFMPSYGTLARKQLEAISNYLYNLH
jgi:mono/diheme cytochrome c family protein